MLQVGFTNGKTCALSQKSLKKYSGKDYGFHLELSGNRAKLQIITFAILSFKNETFT